MRYRPLAEAKSAAILITEAFGEAVEFFPSWVFEQDDYVEVANRLTATLTDKIRTQRGHFVARMANAERALERGDPIAQDVFNDLMRHRREQAERDLGT